MINNLGRLTAKILCKNLHFSKYDGSQKELLSLGYKLCINSLQYVNFLLPSIGVFSHYLNSTKVLKIHHSANMLPRGFQMTFWDTIDLYVFVNYAKINNLTVTVKGVYGQNHASVIKHFLFVKSVVLSKYELIL